jgi:C-3',4' desaturase CrtD
MEDAPPPGTRVKHVVVVGAGVGGLSAAAVLARAGLDVTVLEAHIYAGGCAGTFFHQGYRFDAGATLAAGFYPGGPMDALALAAGIPAWPVRTQELALTVHLPEGDPVHRWTDPARWTSERAKLNGPAEAFWAWQEPTAEAVWGLASQLPPWPPASIPDLIDLIRLGAASLSSLPAGLGPGSLLADALTSAARHLPAANSRLRLFVDGQLMISAQTTSEHANALYAAAALDLPRRGVVQVEGGMGSIAHTLAESIKCLGGRVLYRHEVTGIRVHAGAPVSVETRRGGNFPVDLLILNLTPWNAAALLGAHAPPRLRGLPPHPAGWGAFTVYVGIDASVVPDGFPLHHQVIDREPLGEGNSAFLSISPAWDAGRAPAGKRALTLSTHTRLEPWGALEKDTPAFAEREAAYADRLLASAERVLPGIRSAARLVLPGTPDTFERFTRRIGGWVGGFPQTSLFRFFAPRLAPAIWLAGDSIFPGQSVAATALGGLRVAHQVLRSLGIRSDLAGGNQQLARDAAR